MDIFGKKVLAEANQRIDHLSAALKEQRLETRRLSDKLEESAASSLFNWRIARDQKWSLISGQAMGAFTKKSIDDYASISEFYYIFNPLIKRVVDVRTLFTFAKGFDISSDYPDTKQKYLDPVLNDPYNKEAFTSQMAQDYNDKTLQKGGNLFIAVYKKARPISIRIIPAEEIAEIIYDENDGYKPLFYRRQHNNKTYYYPDFRNTNITSQLQVKGSPDWSVAIYHVYTHKISSLGFGITDIAAAYGWAGAATSYLEDWGAVMKSIRKYSTMVLTPSTNQTQINALGAAFAGNTSEMYNPLQSNPAGSHLTMGGGNEYKVVDAGSSKTIGPSDVRQFILMVCTATGVPETIVTGDPSTGNLATAKELTSPFMTLIENRQNMWGDVLKTLYEYIISIQGVTKDVSVKISFPPLVQEDLGQRIDAVVKAATLDNKIWAGTMDMKDVVREIYQTLDIEITDDELMAIADGVESDATATEAMKRINENAKILKLLMENDGSDTATA